MPRTFKPKSKNYKKAPVSKAVKAYVARTLDNKIEDKFITKALTTVGSIGTSWTEIYPGIIEGTAGDSNRIGRRLSIKSIEIRGVLKPADAYNVVRMVLSVSSSASPMVGSGVGIDDPLLKPSYIGKVLKRVLFDKYILLNQGLIDSATTEYTPKLVPFKYYKTFKKPIIVTYADSLSTTFDKILVLSIISDSIIASHPVFTNGYIVMRYEDA